MVPVLYCTVHRMKWVEVGVRAGKEVGQSGQGQAGLVVNGNNGLMVIMVDGWMDGWMGKKRKLLPIHNNNHTPSTLLIHHPSTHQ